MLDIYLIRNNPDLVKKALADRQMDSIPVDAILNLDEQRRATIQEVENFKAKRNVVSKEIGKMQDPQARQKKIDEMRAVGDQIDALDDTLESIDGQLREFLYLLPNIPDPATPVGTDESENVIIRQEGDIPDKGFEPKPHWDIGPELGLINFEQGVKITGSRFYVLSGAGARLQRALIAWMLDLHISQGYTEKYTPFMVKSETLFGAGQLPKFGDNLYRDHEENLWMVPTAEVPLTGLHRDEILDESSLPILYTAYTPCFRREKTSAGKETRGIKRGHQFDKVEMYIYCLPEESPAMFEKMVADAEETCRQLGFTFRILQLCTGDLGFGSSITYDIEIWAPGCGEWLEVSSISNVTDFQSRRSNIRYRPADSKNKRFVHTLNGSGLGMPRTLIGVLENYQQADGSILIPEVLKPWMGGIDVIEPE